MAGRPKVEQNSPRNTHYVQHSAREVVQISTKAESGQRDSKGGILHRFLQREGHPEACRKVSVSVGHRGLG